MNYRATDQQCELSIDKAIYSIETIHKCFYWYTGDFDVNVKSKDDHTIQVILTTKEGTTENFELLIGRIKQNLIEFKLREILAKETQTVRELIIAKAFANYETESDMPNTEVSDPVGFNPALI